MPNGVKENEKERMVESPLRLVGNRKQSIKKLTKIIFHFEKLSSNKKPWFFLGHKTNFRRQQITYLNVHFVHKDLYFEFFVACL